MFGSTLRITKCRKVKTPTRGTVESAGIDFYVPDDFVGPEYIKPQESINIPSGIKANIPAGYALIAFNKSGISLQGFTVGACVVDSDYQGEIHLHVINSSTKTLQVKKKQKLVQFILLPYAHCAIEEIENEKDLYFLETERGGGSFGSTGL